MSTIKLLSSKKWHWLGLLVLFFVLFAPLVPAPANKASAEHEVICEYRSGGTTQRLKILNDSQAKTTCALQNNSVGLAELVPHAPGEPDVDTGPGSVGPDDLVDPDQLIDADGNGIPDGEETTEETTDSTADGDGQIEEESCEANGGDFSFGLCPMLRWANDAVQVLLNEIRDAVQINPAYYNGVEKDGEQINALRTVWGNLRNIAYILLIPIMLVLVIGTALGFSFLDAYTVKRALPRLLFAVIFMSISYDIGVIVIEFSNVAARGVSGLLASAVGGGDALSIAGLFDPSAGNGVAVAGGALGAGIIAAVSVAVGALSIGILASYLATMALALLIIFFLLLARQLIIIVLLAVLPLAILSWIFPGNDKIWKLVWGTFTKLSFAGIVINAVMISGFILAFIINQATGGAGGPGDGGLDSVFIIAAKLGAIMAGLLGIPWAIKTSFGAASALVGAVNDRSKGVFDRNKQFRANKRKDLGERAKTGNRFKGKNALTNRLNRGAQYASNIKSAGLGRPSTMRANMRAALGRDEHDAASKLAEENASVATIFSDDDKIWAARFENVDEISAALERASPDRFRVNDDDDEATARGKTQARQDAVQEITRAQKEAGQQVFQKARVRAQAKTGTAYRNEEGEFDVSMMLNDINEAYGDDRNGAARALAEMKGSLANSGQIAGLAGFGNMAGQLEGMNHGRISNQDAHNTIMDDAINSATPGQALQGKPDSAAAMGRAHARRIEALAQETLRTQDEETEAAEHVNVIEAGVAAGTNTQQQLDVVRQRHAAAQHEVVRAEQALDVGTAATAGLLDAMGQSSPQNASQFADNLMGQVITGQQVVVTPEARNTMTGELEAPAELRGATVRDMIDQRMNNEEYRNRRRDYGSQAAADANARAAAGPAAAQAGNPLTPPLTPGL